MRLSFCSAARSTDIRSTPTPQTSSANCAPNQRLGLLVAHPGLAKGHEHPGIEPERAAVLMGGEQLLECAVIALSEQAPGEDIPDPLVVVRVQLQHIAVVANGAVDVAKLQERAREAGPGPHIGACFEKAPEVASILPETFRPERQPPRLNALCVVVPSLLDRSGFVGEKNIIVGAKRRDAECFVGERYPRPSGGSLPCLMHHVLRFRRRLVAASSGNRRQEALHRAPVRQRGGGAGLSRFRRQLSSTPFRDWHSLPPPLRPDF